MNYSHHTINEQAVAAAFGKQAPSFDDLYSGDTIIRYKRKRVREHVVQWLPPNSNILELNAGTGEDAIFFAQLGHQIHATDISGEMQRILSEKVKQHDLQNSITYELRSFTDLENLVDRGPYDMIFSNFAGLNCTAELPFVLRSFDRLLKPGGTATLIILPKFCLWELLLIFKGKFTTAFRRFAGKKGAKAQLEGKDFRCWYYNPATIQKTLNNKFEQVALEGLCTTVPPSYLQGFAEKHPKAWQWLVKKEDILKTKWPWKSIGDYYIISLRKK